VYVDYVDIAWRFFDGGVKQLKQGWAGEIKLFWEIYIRRKLLLMTNRKLHMRFRLTPRSMPSDNLELLYPKLEFSFRQPYLCCVFTFSRTKMRCHPSATVESCFNTECYVGQGGLYFVHSWGCCSQIHEDDNNPHGHGRQSQRILEAILKWHNKVTLSLCARGLDFDSYGSYGYR